MNKDLAKLIIDSFREQILVNCPLLQHVTFTQYPPQVTHHMFLNKDAKEITKYMASDHMQMWYMLHGLVANAIASIQPEYKFSIERRGLYNLILFLRENRQPLGKPLLVLHPTHVYQFYNVFDTFFDMRHFTEDFDIIETAALNKSALFYSNRTARLVIAGKFQRDHDHYFKYYESDRYYLIVKAVAGLDYPQDIIELVGEKIEA